MKSGAAGEAGRASPACGFAVRYGRLGASSRLRHWEWRERLAARGWTCPIQNFFPDDYLRKLYAGGGKSKTALLSGWAARRSWLGRAPELLVVEYELFPLLPWRVEAHWWRRRRIVVDFDDNVWEKYARIPVLRHKFDRIVRQARTVLVANDFLLERALRLNPNVVKLPTPIDPAWYPETPPEKFPRFTLAWIGTPVTYPYLEAHGEALREMLRLVDGELLVIASRALENRPIPGVRMRCVDWRPGEAETLLARSHVGIMPLPDDAFSRGKSAYKLIQYLGAGLPSIASPVGENRRVIAEGVTGFTASTPAEWREALRRITASPLDYAAMAKAAQAASDAYTYRALLPRYEAALFSAADATR